MAQVAGNRARFGRALRFALPYGIAALAAVTVGGTLRTDWIGDDAAYSALNGVLGADHLSLWTAMLRAFGEWFGGNGRFYPGSILEKYLVFHFFTDRVAYKLLLLGSALAALEAFRRCVAAYGGVTFANVAALCAVVLLQERGYHDALFAYNAIPQAIAIALALSLWSFRAWLDEGDRRAAWSSALLFGAAALTYEDAYGLALLYPLVARARGAGWSTAWKSAWPQLTVAAVLAALEIAARRFVHLPPDSNYATNFAPHAALVTLGLQLVAALPVSYWLFDPSSIFSRTSWDDFARNDPLSLPFALALGVVACLVVSRLPARDPNPARCAASVGLALAVLPALPLAVVVKYQGELKLGLGYLPVFLQLFGVALLAAAGIAWLAQARLRNAGLAVTVALLTLVGTMTEAANRHLVDEIAPQRIPRQALERQLDAGLLPRNSDTQVVAIATPFDWIFYGDAGPDGIATRGLFYQHGGNHVVLVPAADAAGASVVLRYDRAGERWSAERAPLKRP